MDGLKGIIVSKKSGNTWLVRVLKNGGCASCTLSKFCSLGKTREDENVIEVHGDNFYVGEMVLLEEDTLGVIVASFLIFIMPILVFILGFYFLSLFKFSELVKAIGGLAFLGIYFGIMRLFDEKLRNALFKFRVKKLE